MKLLIFMLLVVVMSGCASPEYQTRYAFSPPANKQGVACVQRCAAQLQQCKVRFNQSAQQCVVRARQQARIEMPGRVKAYENALDVWETRMQRYQRDISMYELQRRNYRMMRGLSHAGCRGGKTEHNKDCRRNYLRWRGAFWLDEPVYPGKAPRRPTLKAVTTEIAKETCAQDNQCVVNYRQCYTGCGGTVKPYKVQ